jgi:PIN domain nuclease of toxin-antitoxin system
MIVGVLDTHTILWFLSGDPRLSATARNFIVNASAAGNDLAISSITLVEMVYLIEKGKIPAGRFTQIVRMTRQPGQGLVEIAVDAEIARSLSKIDIAKVPDMPDRTIAATALYLQVPIVSKDGKIQLSGLTTIW